MDILKTDSKIPTKKWLPEVAVLNKTSDVTNKEIQSVTTALKVQVLRDFAPIWGISADIKFYSDESKVPFDAWKFIFLDTSDQAGALGYHELTPEGYPQGLVFVKESAKAGVAWSTTASHEMLEILLDPYTDLLVMEQKQGQSPKLYAYEVCDPVENDWYIIGGVKVSNFVYPEWFENDAKNPSGKWDFLGNLKAPFTLSKGGYVSYMTISSAGWQQIMAKKSDAFLVCRQNREFPALVGAKLRMPFFSGLWVKIKSIFTGWEEAFSKKRAANLIKADEAVKNAVNTAKK